MSRWVVLLTLTAVAICVDAEPLIVSGYGRFGEGWNEPLSDDANDRDDEDLSEYDFSQVHLSLEKRLSERVRVHLDLDDRSRRYEIASSLDNEARRAGLRLQFDPTERLTFWLRGSAGRKNYDRSNLDNDPRDASVEARWRRGVRDHVRVGASYAEAEYRADPGRDRSRRRLFAGWERPLTDRFVVELKGDVEDRSFRRNTAARRDATSRSVTLGFRWEAGE